MVREAHKHGGSGWLKYDKILRKNNPGLSAPWDISDPSLLTIVANQSNTPCLPCHCQELDHSSPGNARWPLFNSQGGALPNPDSKATCAAQDALLPTTCRATPTTPEIPKTDRVTLLLLVRAAPLGHAFASHGTRGNAHSRAPVPMLTSAPPVTAHPIGHETAQRYLPIPALRSLQCCYGSHSRSSTGGPTRDNVLL